MGSQSTKKKIDWRHISVITVSVVSVTTLLLWEIAYCFNISESSLSTFLLKAFNATNEDNESQLVEFVNVGQGDCTIIKSGEMTAVVDFGEVSNSVIQKRLLKLGVDRVDLAIITHHHSDHMGGFLNLLESMPVDRLMINDSTAEDGDRTLYNQIMEATRKRNVQLYRPKEGSTFEIGNATIKVLYTSDTEDEENNRSTVIMITVGGKKILITGDGENQVEKHLYSNCNIDCDILKLGHHGSYTSSSEKFLKTATPTVAIASSGYNNLYGHPSKWTVERLELLNVKLYRTDLDKTVTVTFDERKDTFSITTERRQQW